jgi:tetraacyldisaccharide 4'-kinase
VKLLRPAEALYQRINGVRRSLYRRGTLHARRLPRPVISIGNIAVGGSGKTPATIALTHMLATRGIRACILTRGYGRSSKGIQRVDSSDARMYGDEPAMMHQAFPSIPIVVGSDRFQSGQWFLKRGECDVFVLDDGFQHLQLERDCDIVIVTASSRFHRETSRALRDADVIIARGATVDPSSLSPGTLLMHASLEPTMVIVGEEMRPMSYLRHRSVVAFAGLADNKQFFSLLEREGATIVQRRDFRDHYSYSPDDLADLERLATANEALLVTTAKDWMKLRRSSIAYIEVEMAIDDPDHLMQHVLERCRLNR